MVYDSKYREYHREYMRRYRQPTAPACQVCKGPLTGQQTKFCGRSCRLKDYYRRHVAQTQARYQRWSKANSARSVARVKAWRQANPERQASYVRKWRNKDCPFCPGKLCWPALACRKCTIGFGCLCHDNTSCGVAGKHKHCPCGMPVVSRKHYQIQPCQFCQAEMDRLGLSLEEMFRQDRELESAA